MVRTEGADKRSTARFLAYGVNGLSVALMVVVFAQTAGLTGAEVGIAGGGAVLGQKLLEAVFGDQAVRTLAERARRKLEVRVRALLEEERPATPTCSPASGIDPASRRPGPQRRARRGRPALRRRRTGRDRTPTDAPGTWSTATVPTRLGRHVVSRGRRVTSLLEGARRLVSRGSDLGDRIEGLGQASEAARGRLDDAGRRRRRGDRRPGRDAGWD